MIYNDQKEVIENIVLNKGTNNIGYHIPKGVWHTVVSLETGTVLFETREGPYMPVEECDILK